MLNTTLLEKLTQVLLDDEGRWFEAALQFADELGCSEESVVVNVLFAGAKHSWLHRNEKDDWNRFILASSHGQLLLEWYNAWLALGLIGRINALPPHRVQPKKAANTKERILISAEIPRSILRYDNLMIWAKPGIRLATLEKLVN